MSDMMQQLPPNASGPRIHLASLGCAKNLVDSEKLLARLALAGGHVGAAPDEADIVIVNTCGFIGPARDESVRTAHEYGTLRRDGTIQKLIVMGCLAQRDADALRAELPEVDVIVGLRSHDEIVRACDLEAPVDAGDARLLLTPAHAAYLRISDGCDNRCSYCTIPLIRGGFQSRSPEAILGEARDLVANGAKELVVIGQDTTSYGKDLVNAPRVHELLGQLAALDPVHWIRLLYTHPAHFSEALIDAYAANAKLCAYVDIPLQHLNDSVLHRMGRKVTQATCLRIIEALRRAVPEIAIRTTFIVGFPGETDAQFEELLALTKELRFDHMGAFAYSAEEGTEAATFPDQVPEAVVTERLERLMLAQQEIAFERNDAMVGTTREVLIDEATEQDDLWVGRTESQAPDVDSITFVTGDGLELGDFVHARIIGSQDYDLIAEV